MPDQTHNPELTSWVESANLPNTGFPIQNLPFCTFRRPTEDKSRVGVAIGEEVLDVSAAFDIVSLRDVMSSPRPKRHELRGRISKFLSDYVAGAKRFVAPAGEVVLELPCEIRNYSDFYASIDHATNVGRLFRPDQPLLPNYRWVPIAYHGRASSIVVSGSSVRRPHGQIVETPAGPPRFAATRALDYEVEIGAFLGPGNAPGQSIPIAEAEDHLFGICLLNDWSARDIQAWEYQPLGPFLAKSFCTAISPWVVTLEALEPFRCAAPPHAEVLNYLNYLNGAIPAAFSIRVEAWLKTPHLAEPHRLSTGNVASLYWTLAQMIAHHSSNGCPLLPGDLIGSGTVSGPDVQNRGCLLEITLGGRDPLTLPSGETRTYLEDGDEIILRGWCETPGFRRIGLGACSGIIAA